MLGTDGEVLTNSKATFSCGLLHMDGCINVDRSAKTYIHQLYADTGYYLEGLLTVMAGRDGWQEKLKGIHAHNTTWFHSVWDNSLMSLFCMCICFYFVFVFCFCFLSFCFVLFCFCIRSWLTEWEQSKPLDLKKGFVLNFV